MKVHRARPQEAAAISELALQSKALWGYDEAFLEACRDELTFTESDILDQERAIFVATDTDALAGFYALSPLSSGKVELDALFVHPQWIGRGIGRRLFEHARTRARDIGAQVISIQSDPYAEPFYLALGAVRVGEKPSGSIPGRVLPLLSVTLRAADNGGL